MKTKTILFLLLHFSCIAFAQLPSHNQFKNDLARQKIRGKVKTVTEKEFNANGDSLKLRSVTSYNDTGNMVLYITYSQDGTTLSRTTFK